ncbi:vWA-MoxR associated conflict system protein [Streptomyces poonensis]|uniref:vWA-MoxR associated protein middle region 2 domain-containing protein n=1 Tax=Streptomyces poonensis TaxID=68255 RepID=A0A918UU12_9ACTN|nr:hypothetical protein [Streptomyces poonensis]GGZ35342.1 hypothetical protein GCM10010365_65210 [Streptomyces poonensis]GLJ89582.1 hypothetical protein GCM10017589_21820 [Streptomyces poonensis]
MIDGTIPPRHVLVVGAQCEDARLEGLEDAARALHTALVDPGLGGCVDRGEESLLIGTGLGRERVHAAVVRAARAAQRDRGSLVLALIGHGEGTEGTPLHFVVSGRTNGPELDNMNVPDLLGSVANHPGVTGLLTIVDTCLAGGAVPDASRITMGRQEGGVRFGLLFAAAAKEEAYRMRLSKGLVRLMEEGLPGAGDLLTVDERLLEKLREEIEGQQLGGHVFNGAPAFGDSLWLARNRAAALGHSLGAIAGKAVQDAVRRIDTNLRLTTEEEITAWLREHPPAPGDRSWFAVRRLQEVQAELAAGRKTLRVVNKVFGPELTEESLQLAGLLAGLPLTWVRHEPPRALRDLVEYAAHHGDSMEGAHRALARLVAALAHVTGHGDRLPGDVIGWAQDLGLTATVNSRLRELTGQPHGERAPRLVLVLVDDGGESIVRVDAWLLYGRAVLAHQGFPCPARPDGTTKALAEALAWAGPWANVAGGRLSHIDVAAPTLTLLDRPPEDQIVRKQRLGANYTVTTRWSGLLTPPPDFAIDDMLQVGEQLLASMEEQRRACQSDDEPPGPAWLLEQDLETVEQLQELLVDHGCGQRVWAVTSLPRTDWDFMAQELLEHTPALVWPRQKDIGDAQALQASVRKHWQALPQQIAHAYRKQLSRTVQDPDGDLGPLAAVRTAWHDHDWQAFCQRRARAVVRAPHETTSKERA